MDRDNKTDRSLGKAWEQHFVDLAVQEGRQVVPLQIGRKESAAAYFKVRSQVAVRPLPDVLIPGQPTQWHEIKHKRSTRYGTYGLEVYRFEHLLNLAKSSGDLVLYTIHDWELAGASKSSAEMDNDIRHWLTADVELLDLAPKKTFSLPSWVNGVLEPSVPQHFWPSDFWTALSNFWTPQSVLA